MKRRLINRLGLLGVVSLISYAAAVIFSPLAYPGYDWLSQAVSDLSAENAPSRMLWEQLSALYNCCEVVCLTLCCIYIQGRLTKTLRAGIYLFTVMSWISHIGYKMFPLSDSGYAETFQDFMHLYIVTVLVVGLSVVSLITVIVGGVRSKHKGLAVTAGVALALMFAGAVGTAAVKDGAIPMAYFGVFERFSVFAAVGFTAVLGVGLFNGFGEPERSGD